MPKVGSEAQLKGLPASPRVRCWEGQRGEQQQAQAGVSHLGCRLSTGSLVGLCVRGAAALFCLGPGLTAVFPIHVVYLPI